MTRVDVTDETGAKAESPAPFAQSADAVLQGLGADPTRGLAAAQVASLRERYGFNELETVPPEPVWRRFLRQFSDVVVWLLIVAAVVSGVLQEWTDAIVIIAIVLLNAMLGFIQEEKAGRGLAAIHEVVAAPVLPVPGRQI